MAVRTLDDFLSNAAQQSAPVSTSPDDQAESDSSNIDQNCDQSGSEPVRLGEQRRHSHSDCCGSTLVRVHPSAHYEHHGS